MESGKSQMMIIPALSWALGGVPESLLPTLESPEFSPPWLIAIPIPSLPSQGFILAFQSSWWALPHTGHPLPTRPSSG